MTHRMTAAERQQVSRETDDTWADYASHADQRTREENEKLYAQVENGRAKLRRG